MYPKYHVFLFVLLQISTLRSSSAFTYFSISGKEKYALSGSTTRLFEISKKDESSSLKRKQKKVSGVYSRPSAAIERGSGFYVPGLEGYRVRIFSGVAILALSFVNVQQSQPDSSAISGTLELSMNLANGYGLLLLFQALIDVGKETLFANSDDGESTVLSSKSTSNVDMEQIISPTLKNDDALEAAVQWAAATFISLTPSNKFMLLSKEEILYSLGTGLKSSLSTQANECTVDVFETLSSSKSGRVAVPSTHPIFSIISENSRRCVILQRINESKAIVVGSDQLLQSYTKSDLRWLGNLARYIDNSVN